MPISLLTRFPKLRAPTQSLPVIPENSRGDFSSNSHPTSCCSTRKWGPRSPNMTNRRDATRTDTGANRSSSSWARP